MLTDNAYHGPSGPKVYEVFQMRPTALLARQDRNNRKMSRTTEKDILSPPYLRVHHLKRVEKVKMDGGLKRT